MLFFYLFGALITGGIWFTLFWLDQTTPKTDLASWEVLLVACLIWPVAFPHSFVKMLK